MLLSNVSFIHTIFIQFFFIFLEVFGSFDWWKGQFTIGVKFCLKPFLLTNTRFQFLPKITDKIRKYPNLHSTVWFEGTPKVSTPTFWPEIQKRDFRSLSRNLTSYEEVLFFSHHSMSHVSKTHSRRQLFLGEK